MYAEDDPNGVVFDLKTRGRLEANHWKVATFVVGVIAAGSVWTRNPPPSVTTVVGVSSDVQGKPIVRKLSQYQPDDQAVRWSAGDIVTRLFTIEPILTPHLQDSRLALNVNTVKQQMNGAAVDQLRTWLDEDQPFKRITENPKLVRLPKLGGATILPDSTVAVDFTTTTIESYGAKPIVEHYTLTMRYQVTPVTADDAVTLNPYGFHPVFFTVQKNAA
ncbi:Type IV secretion system protein (plasmid) [Pararobbsia alpina]|uniref:type IV secretion system protein n=1 Tax=Pararobbsia alpina TaxID=621374 RepID=UPI0039A4E488